MDKNKCAKNPPMGWNSWDCYGAAVNEEAILGNALYMAEHLKKYGWEYIVCDIQWYEPTASSHYYNKFAQLEMDEYSRLVPAVNRFPSAEGGKGFGPIAEKIHAMGLKFGIHIMRGIPRQAAYLNTKIKGTNVTARQIAAEFSICSWNTDMYGVDPHAEGAQEYYDSLFEMYAGWGIDFVKVDDICVTEFRKDMLYSAKEEIEMIRKAIDKCGREIVLSLSPGPAQPEYADHLTQNANMWRMTGDFWDNWKALNAMFERCRIWAPYVKTGCWPDCDMLPLGKIVMCEEKNGIKGHMTNFTHDEQITMMTLWCIFRSPLMMGGEMRENDSFTLELLTNDEVLNLEKNTSGARELFNDEKTTIWSTVDRDGNRFIAVFNRTEEIKDVELSFDELLLGGRLKVRDLWTHEELGTYENVLKTRINAHGAKLYKFYI